MLPATVRLRRRADFDAVMRGGKRSGHGPLVVHVQTGMPQTRVGFIVGRGVGNAVTRHRVTRQLRHLMRVRHADLPAGSGVVVRALPAAADRRSTELAPSLDHALRRALSRARASSAGAARTRPVAAASS